MDPVARSASRKLVNPLGWSTSSTTLDRWSGTHGENIFGDTRGSRTKIKTRWFWGASRFTISSFFWAKAGNVEPRLRLQRRSSERRPNWIKPLPEAVVIKTNKYDFFVDATLSQIGALSSWQGTRNILHSFWSVLVALKMFQQRGFGSAMKLSRPQHKSDADLT